MRQKNRESNESNIIRKVIAAAESGEDLESLCEILAVVRREGPERGGQLDRDLLGKLHGLHRGLVEAQTILEKLRQENEKLTSPPWCAATFVRLLPDLQKAMIWYRGSLQIVNIANEVDAGALERGDEVFLTLESNVLVAKSPDGAPAVGETASFERYAGGGRLVVRSRDQEILVEPTSSLEGLELAIGDRLRWDKATCIAYERIESADGEQYFQTEIPHASPEQVGGHRRTLKRMLTTLTRTLSYQHIASKYQLGQRQSMLLVGPPGCGKTLMVRVAASQITQMSGEAGKPCRIAIVKPGEWEDPYVGVTQQRIRGCFDGLRRAAEEAHVLLYLDEIEAVGRVRGSTVGFHSDKFLAAFLAELDGFTSRGGVAVIAGTNRKELLDPAILERLSDVELQVGRPGLPEAREIFAIHLPASLPFSPNGSASQATRNELIDHAVSRLYAPNANNELCVIKFRDGKTRTVGSRELVSGRLIEQISRAARQVACDRDAQLGDAGLRREDIDEAVSDAIDRLSTTLSPRNAHCYLFDLPQDVDVVSVQPIVRRNGRAHRYLNGPEAKE